MKIKATSYWIQSRQTWFSLSMISRTGVHPVWKQLGGPMLARCSKTGSICSMIHPWSGRLEHAGANVILYQFGSNMHTHKAKDFICAYIISPFG
jgi:hypothetical protein